MPKRTWEPIKSSFRTMENMRPVKVKPFVVYWNCNDDPSGFRLTVRRSEDAIYTWKVFAKGRPTDLEQTHRVAEGEARTLAEARRAAITASGELAAALT